MTPTSHATTNTVLKAPPGLDSCDDLAVTRFMFQDGTPGVASFWQPTPEELALLVAGKPVRVYALGITQPPLHVGVDGDGVMF